MLVPLGSTCFSFQQSQVYIISFFHNTKSQMWTGTQPSIGRTKSIFRLFPSFWRLIAKPDQRWQANFIEYAKSTTRKRDWITAVNKMARITLGLSRREASRTSAETFSTEMPSTGSALTEPVSSEKLSTGSLLTKRLSPETWTRKGTGTREKHSIYASCSMEYLALV